MKEIKNFEAMFEAGVNPYELINYAHRYRNWFEFARQQRILTPLRIVYLGQENRMICLPFLDLNFKDKVWGIEIDGTYYGITALGKVRQAEITDSLACAEKQLFGEEASELYRCYGCTEQRFDMPQVFELQALRKQRNGFEQTADILRSNGVEVADWFAADIFWANSNDRSRVRTYDARTRRRRVEAPESDEQSCLLMTVMRSVYPIDCECSLADDFRFYGENEPDQTMSYL
ncbi:MAG: hypothetical protein J6N49_02425 [Alphaproteobacteria bacterium]|nr:hypothetical protein [Alphaproteobacteria bacterium]